MSENLLPADIVKESGFTDDDLGRDKLDRELDALGFKGEGKSYIFPINRRRVREVTTRAQRIVYHLGRR